MTASAQVAASVRTLSATLTRGLVAMTHNSLAVVGLLVAFTTLALFCRDDLRHSGEEHLRHWLLARQEAKVDDTAPFASAADTTLSAIERATATNPRALPEDQASVTYWLSKKYRVAPEPLAALVSEAYQVGRETQLDPTLILAIMAVESSFNPFAQSAVGAQGLMQVMTKVHTDKYEDFGGHFAAFDPVTNLRVGVQVLQECIRRAGSLERGLKYYVGAANLRNDGGYAAKVMAEHFRIKQVANGRGSLPLPPAKQPMLSAAVATPPAAPSQAGASAVALADKPLPLPEPTKAAAATTVALGS